MRSTILRFRQVFTSSNSAIAAGLLVCLGIAIYVLWYASAGHFSTLVPIDNAYIDLGEAFLHGQLSLPEKPSPELLALENPYDPATRIAPYLWDASLYEGQYYLYWGPVPALAFAVVEGITHTRPPGPLLVVICNMTLPIILMMILYRLRRYFFPHAPGFSIGLCILMGFINLPFLFLLGRSAIYETSVIAGQFFLCLGLLCWVMYITGAGKARWLIMAGLNWGLAVGSRYNLVVSIMIYLAFALVQIVRGANGDKLQRRIAFLLIPFTLCMIGLGIYNFARFDNPLETGMKYQLSIPQDQDGFYSTSYVLSNLFIYLSYPLTTSRSFPFIVSTLPLSGRFDEIVAGLISSTPGVWLLALAIPSFILKRRSTNTFQDIPGDKSLKHFLAMIMAGALVQFLFLTVLFYAAMRYISDFYLPLVLGIWILVWQVDEHLRRVAWLRVAFWIIVTTLVIWTVGIGFFGSFDIPPGTFRVSNPGLYMRIASFWNHWFQALGIFRAN